jgi:hypothetical protein
MACLTLSDTSTQIKNVAFINTEGQAFQGILSRLTPKYEVEDNAVVSLQNLECIEGIEEEGFECS